MKNKSHLLSLFLSGLMLVQLPAQIAALPDFSSITNALNTIPTPIKSTLIQIPLAYGALYTTTALHECGHAAAAISINAPVKGIFLGRYATDTEINSMKKGTFSYGFGINPHQGEYCLGSTKEITPLKKFFIFAAGPIVGALSCYALIKACGSNQSIKDMLLEGFKPDSNTFIIKSALLFAGAENLANLLPDGQENDGAQICDSLQISVPEQTIDSYSLYAYIVPRSLCAGYIGATALALCLGK